MWSVLSVQLETKVLVHTVYTIGNGVVCSARNARAKRMCRKRNGTQVLLRHVMDAVVGVVLTIVASRYFVVLLKTQ